MNRATTTVGLRRMLWLSLLVAACLTWGSLPLVLAEGATESAAAASADGAAEEDATATKGETQEEAKDEAKTQAEKSESAAAKAEQAVETKAAKVRLAQFVLENELPETTSQLGLFGETMTDLRELVSRIDKAAKDDSIAGAIIDIRQPAIGRGKIAELRAAIARFRASGKKAYAQMEAAMPSDYMIASACDRIVMPETGVVILPGVRAEGMFFKGLLGKLGIEGDFIHMGPYKGAAEPLMRSKFSPPVRENMTALVDGLYDQMVTTIVKDRPISVAKAKEIIDTGLVTANQAKELGLIDEVAYPDSLRDELAKTYNAKPLVYVENYGKKQIDTDFSGPAGFFKLMQTLLGETKEKEAKGKKIAIVYAVGPIVTGKADDSLFAEEIVASTTLVKALRDAAEDDEVAAVVLRVDSPGGSALASDLIWHQTRNMGKPIVASMGDVAGSGGYYISMGTDKIIAAPGTITGSIGVVGGKLSLKGTYEKIGITTDVIQRGQNSGMFSSGDKFTESERAVITKMMEDIYAQFTTKAAEGRHMPVEKLRELAGGRIYTGTQAKDNGLVDQLGTLHDAVIEAKKLAGLDPEAEVRIEVLPKPTNIFESLFGEGQTEKEVEVRLGRYLDQFAPGLADAARQACWLRLVFDRPTAAVIMPFELKIR
jgi:protease-4